MSTWARFSSGAAVWHPHGKHGVRKGSTVAILCPNIPEMVEAHFGIPMQGAVLNTMNYRLDAATILFRSITVKPKSCWSTANLPAGREALHKSGRRR